MKSNMALPKDKIDSFIKADVYRVLSKGFSYPDDKNIYEMKSIIEELTSFTHLKQNLYNYLEKILSTSEIKELQRDYSRLFLKGRVPICESSYSLNFDEVSNVTTFYKAFGLSPKSGDLPDSLPYELEFASILSLKSALAQNEDNEGIAKDAFKKFLREHLVEFVKKFSDKVEKAEPNLFYKTIAELLKNSVERDMM
ncbi:MAG: molecular chaperone TorD family protein, partial [Deltaproteobacteria bacterium]|nr:molecular chaperone TorD family protein [Deltaproteobacteria bacterium]